MRSGWSRHLTRDRVALLVIDQPGDLGAPRIAVHRPRRPLHRGSPAIQPQASGTGRPDPRKRAAPKAAQILDKRVSRCCVSPVCRRSAAVGVRVRRVRFLFRFHRGNHARRARFRNNGAVFFAHVIDPAGLDDELIACPALFALQQHKLCRQFLSRCSAERRKRLDDGEFGYCAGCGEDIAPGRLAADPTTPQCIDCATGAGGKEAGR